MSNKSKFIQNQLSVPVAPTAEWSDKLDGAEIYQFTEASFTTERIENKHHLLLFVFTGVIDITASEKNFRLLPAQAFFQPARFPHSASSQKETSFVGVLIPDHVITPKQQPLKWQPQQIVNDYTLNFLMKEIDHELSRPDLHSDSALVSLMQLLTIHLLRKHSTVDTQQPAPLARSATCEVMRAIEFIEINLASPLLVSEICKLTSLSQKVFLQTFKQVTGQTPQQYLIKRRVQMAEHLLLRPSLTVDDIAKKAGFVDQSHFTKAFRKLRGMTPAEFRKQ